MESRLKKLFHRKKDHSPEQPLHESQKSAAATSSPALQTSLYDSAPAGGAPQKGSYPIKGNNSSGALPKRKSSLRGHGHEDLVDNISRLPPTEHHQGMRGYPTVSRSIDNDRQTSKNSQPSAVVDATRYEEHERPLPEVPPLQAFSALSLEDGMIPRSSTQPQSSRHSNSRFLVSHQEGAAASQNDPYARNLRHDNQLHTHQPPHVAADTITHALSSDVKNESMKHFREAGEPFSTHAAPSGSRNNRHVPHTSGGIADSPTKYVSPLTAPTYDLSRSQPQDESDLHRRNSIPRKQLRDHTKGQSSGLQPPFSTGRTLSANVGHPSRPDPTVCYDDPQLEERKDNPTRGVLDRSRPISRGPGTANSAERVVDRAKSNTINTEVIETFAPAVVHETVHQDIHHIREEVITREIHTHDVYHRILPVIDVEVLPPRHFLPVEGGGLVEISGSEVPGRGQNWVIAETASKIPSDQRAPKATNRFSARGFAGNEGDSKRYITPEGVEKTEQTWVHPPELETGGRDTGQTWPLRFEGDGGDNVAGGPSSSKLSM
ncbi:hypothetical protein MMC07_009020 [Pseudocyphellaria aurata]|nr:hypothetical protein [Pseudocyphellaria aurata]